MKKRLFTLALALMLCLSLMPMAALAAEEESAAPVEEMVEETIEETIEETAEPVALALDGEATPVTITSGNLSDHVSSEAPYGAAVYQFKDGNNFKLGESIDLSDEDSSLNINTSIALDLNGQQLKVNNLVVAGGATLTLTDSGENGELIITVEDCYIQGTLNANGGTVRGKIAVNKDAVIASDGIASDGTPTVFEGSVTLNGEIKGGVFKNDITISVSNPTISGGTFYGDIGYTNSNPCNITGGTFYGGVSNCTISGGIFYGTIEDDCAVAGDSDELVFMNGNDTYAVVVVPSGSTATKPTEPTAPENQRFTGWYKDVDCNTLFDFSSAVTGDVTLYAGFESTVASATVTGKELTYTGEARELVSVSNIYGCTVEYKVGESGTYGSAIPKAKDAGTYKVYYKLTPNEGYTGGSEASVSVTIAPKEVTVSGITAVDKTYDGNTTATLKYDAVNFEGKVDGDDLSVSASGTFVDENAGDGKTVNISGLTLSGTAVNNYALASSDQQTTTTDNIAPKTVSAIVTVAEGPYTYTGSEIKPDVTVKNGETTIPAGEYTVNYSDNINAGTAKVSVTNKDGGNYIVSGSASFTIAKAASSATVTGKTLSYTGEEQELVTESDVKGGDVYYSVNAKDPYEKGIPTEKDVGTYTIDWYVEGDDNHERSTDTTRVTVTIAVPAGVGDAVKGMTVDTVTGDDRETIEATQKTVKAYLDMSPTETEKTTLNALKDTLEKMITRLDEVKAALESKTITDADGITKNDVKTGDKKTLENAKAAIEKLMEDYKDNLTATEQRTLNIKLERIGDALDEIAVLEKKNAEKDKANGVAQTGDTATPILWIVIVVAAVAAVVILLVVRKKKSK